MLSYLSQLLTLSASLLLLILTPLVVICKLAHLL
jgi:hypothetical protein